MYAVILFDYYIVLLSTYVTLSWQKGATLFFFMVSHPYTSLALPTYCYFWSSSVPLISVITWPVVEGSGRQLRMFVNYVLFLSVGSTCVIQHCQYISHINGSLIIFTIDCKCWKYVFNIQR